jgi:hypothetical protein
MLRTQLLLVLIAITAAAGFAQTVSVGVTGGVPLLYGVPSTPDALVSATDESRPYVVGPSIQLALPHGFAVELDALYRRLGERESGVTAFPTNVNSSDRWRGNAWEFPILGKYYFGKRERWQPFVGTGMAMRWLSRTHQGNETGLFGTSYVIHQSDEQFIAGETGAAGIRIRTGRIKWLPQFRYTH